MDINDILGTNEFKSLDDFLTSEMNKFAGDEFVQQMIKFWGDKSVARDWFYSNAVGLGCKRPYDYCKDGRVQEVKDLLGRIDYGSAL